MNFNAEILRTNLRNQGIAEPLINAMVTQAEKLAKKAAEGPSKPKKKKSGWHPGMPSNSTKIEADVTVYARCETCSHVEVKIVHMTIKKDSPLEQKVAVSLCKHCPEYFRQFNHETLVSLVLIDRHHGLTLEHLPTLTQIRMARKMKGEEVVTYTHVK